MEHVVLLAGSSHPLLAKEVAQYLEIDLSPLTIETFPDQEILVEVGQSVRGKDVFVLQSIARRPNRYLMELLTTIDALKRASAKSIVVVLPYFGYARQDRRMGGRVPITAKLVADLLETAGATRVLTMDLHAAQIQGFFDVPVDNLFGRPLLVAGIRGMGLNETVVVAPDAGSTKIARAFAADLGAGYALVDKERVSAETVQAVTVIGDVEGRDVCITDDMVTTAGTLVASAEAVKERGCGRVIAVASHGLLVGEALERIANSPIDKVLITNSVPGAEEIARNNEKIEVVSVAQLFGEAINRIVWDRSIASMFARK